MATSCRGAGRRAAGRRPPSPDARVRLVDAEAFLEAATIATNPDVKATNAIHAAIAAADAICCIALWERSADANHTAAVACVRQATTLVEAARTRIINA